MFLKIRDTIIDSEAVAYVRQFRNESSPLNIKETYGLRIGFKNSDAAVSIPFDNEKDARKYYDELGSMLEAVSL
ncbi:MAG: hypothetical protein IJL32_16355 [Oscillospiraceae bacterium]|nr:hypothetical protein [Oscillospiraceae bacterium]